MTAFHNFVDGSGGHHTYFHVLADAAVKHTDKNNNTAVTVVLAVKNQSFQRCSLISGRSRHVRHDIIQHGFNIQADLRADFRCILGGDSDNLFNLILHSLRVGCGQVNLVDHRKNLQIVVHGEIGVGKRLRFNPLGCIDDQQGSLTGRQRAADLIIEVNMARRVNQVKGIFLSVRRAVIQTDSTGFDCNASLFLELHIIKDLILHDTLLDGAALLYQPVGKGRLAMVNMCDN